jgi:hypothetical protein
LKRIGADIKHHGAPHSRLAGISRRDIRRGGRVRHRPSRAHEKLILSWVNRADLMRV